MEIPEKVRYILEQLQCNGYEGYAVGGCVRDSLLGRKPGDWDITTSANPNQVKNIFKKTVDTGIAHGTVTVLLNGEGFEVTTYRLDGEYEDHRHPQEVTFTPNLSEDLKRRDFTINAMAYNPETGIVDLFDGCGDIQKKCIRCVGNPQERFAEDALRMLRGVRFAGQLGFDIEDETLSAIEQQSSTIRNVSAERIRVELTKLLLSNRPDKLLLAVHTGLCDIFLPEFCTMLMTEQNNPHHCYSVGEHALHAVENIQMLCREHFDDNSYLSPYRGKYSEEKAQIILVFAALLHDIGKPSCKSTDEDDVDHFYGHDVKGSDMAKKVMQRLKFDNDTINMVTRLVRFHERRYHGEKRELRRLASKAGNDLMPFLFILQKADILSQSSYMRDEKLMKIEQAQKLYQEICEANEPLGIKDLDVTGRDIIGLGVKPGPEVGKILQNLLDFVIDDPQKNNSKDLLTEALKTITIEGK